MNELTSAYLFAAKDYFRFSREAYTLLRFEGDVERLRESLNLSSGGGTCSTMLEFLEYRVFSAPLIVQKLIRLGRIYLEDGSGELESILRSSGGLFENSSKLFAAWDAIKPKLLEDLNLSLERLKKIEGELMISRREDRRKVEFVASTQFERDVLLTELKNYEIQEELELDSPKLARIRKEVASLDLGDTEGFERAITEIQELEVNADKNPHLAALANQTLFIAMHLAHRAGAQ